LCISADAMSTATGTNLDSEENIFTDVIGVLRCFRRSEVRGHPIGIGSWNHP
jgi:hypothetical protein